MVVAIDGPAGVGKSTLAEWIANKYGFFNLNSGAFYRAIAVKILDDGIQDDSDESIIAAARAAKLDIVDGVLQLDGENIEHRLRNDAVDHWSSKVSSIVAVRHIVNEHLRRIAGKLNLVAEGRDMTTVVFPDAELKLFLDADPSVRAQRRLEQGTSSLSVEDIEKSIRERDYRDRNKEEGALRLAPDAVTIDTSALTLEEVYDKVSRLFDTHLQNKFQE